MNAFSFKGQDREIELREGDIVLGRSSECGVLLDSETVSRKHARVSVREGSVFIEDLGSRNGTFVNGRQIAEKVQVKPGDAVQFGDVRFELFQTPPAEARTVIMSQEAVPSPPEQAPRPSPPAPEPSVQHVPPPPPARPAPSPAPEPRLQVPPHPQPEPVPSSLHKPQPAPTSHAEGEQRFAPLGKRALAQIIDGLVAFGIFFFAGMQIAPRFGGRTEAGFDLTGGPALVVMAVVTAVLFAYFVLLEGTLGATLGKLTAGIRVRSVDGGRAGIGASLVRNLLRIIDGIAVYLVGAVVMLLTKRKQRLGDLAARTVVVEHNWGGAVRVVGLFMAIAVAVGGAVGGFLTAPPMQAKPSPAEERVSRRAEQKAPAASVPIFGTETKPAQPEGGRGGMIATAVMSSEISAEHEPLAAADRFAAGQRPLYLAFKAVSLPPKTVIKGVLIAEDVGDAAPPNSRLAETSVTATDGGNVPGHFRFTLNPAWVPGRYRVELSVNDRPAPTVRFSVTP